MQSLHSYAWIIAIALSVAPIGGGGPTVARAEDPEPAPTSAASQPPSPTPAGSPPAAPGAREALLEEKLRQLEAKYEALERRDIERNEAIERQYRQKYEELAKQFQALQEKMQATTAASVGVGVGVGTGGGDQGASSGAGPQGTIGRGTSGNAGPPGGTLADEIVSDMFGEPPFAARSVGERAGIGPEGTIGRRSPAGQEVRLGAERNRPVEVSVGNGLRFDSEDGEFAMQFHDLTQAELRNFPGAGGQSPLHTQFFIPRQRWYFVGRATKNIEFYTVINRGYGSLDLLDAFININFDKRIQFRVGRTKTPTSYEYYQIAEGDLIAPERSIFVGNLSGNRQDGAMFHGVILDNRSEWALGVFNGPRRSFQDFNNDKDLYAFFNIRPWGNSERFTGLRYFNIGGEFDFGNENNPLQPSILTTANDETSASNNPVIQSLSPAFLLFNNNVVERGWRQHWAAWIAWYYKSFNILAQYNGEFQDYAQTGSKYSTKIPYEGLSVTTYYFLTGEQITRRVDIHPNRDFAIRNGKITGPGAVEIYSRVSTLDIGRQIFTAGFADPNLWSNHALALDNGFNWYWNQYTKIYFDYQYSVLGNPVYNGTHAFSQHFNLVWLRFQLFF